MKRRLPPWRRLAGWLLAGLVLVWRACCRRRVVNDPRPALRNEAMPCIGAMLHAHQLAGLLANDEPAGGVAAMVSRSADGELAVPSLRVRRVEPVRGSSGALSKGGPRALSEMRERLVGGASALLTVDGPQGPRNRVKRGVAELALRVPGAVVVPVLALPSRRWVLGRSWDRFQVPLPFSTVSLVFGEPVRPHPDEGVEALRVRIEVVLCELEREWDPTEAAREPDFIPSAFPPRLRRST